MCIVIVLSVNGNEEVAESDVTRYVANTYYYLLQSILCFHPKPWLAGGDVRRTSVILSYHTSVL